MSGRRVGDYTGAIILILVGVVLLLNTTGLLAWSAWASLWKYWPVLVILWGVSIMFGRGSALAGILIAVLAIALVVSAVSYVAPEAMRYSRSDGGVLPHHKEFSVAYDDYKPSETELKVRLGAGDLFLSTANGGNLLDAVADYSVSGRAPQLRTTQSGGRLTMEYQTDREGLWFVPFISRGREQHRITLGRPEIPTSLLLEVGAGRIDAVLEKLAARSISITIGGGEAKMEFATPPQSASLIWGWGSSRGAGELDFHVGAGTIRIAGIGNSKLTRVSGELGAGSANLDFSGSSIDHDITADVNVGTGKLSIVVPESLGLRIRASIGTGSLWVDGEKRSQRNIGAEDTWESPNYRTARARLDVVADVGPGKIEVECIH
ncbi:MAG: LiaF-related protein [Clostridia bacterium]|nr:LiaF-related protein [Clostridia bacterium]